MVHTELILIEIKKRYRLPITV